MRLLGSYVPRQWVGIRILIYKRFLDHPQQSTERIFGFGLRTKDVNDSDGLNLEAVV